MASHVSPKAAGGDALTAARTTGASRHAGAIAAIALAGAISLGLPGALFSPPLARAAEGSLSGSVTYPNGSPAPGVNVTIAPWPPSASAHNSYTTTDPTGHWSYSPLPMGSYRIIYVVTSSEGANQTEAGENVALSEAQPRLVLATRLSGPEGPGVGTLIGTALTAAGLPPAGATVTLTSPTGWALPPQPGSFVSAAGRFDVVAPAGSYQLKIVRELGPEPLVDAAGAESLVTTANVPAGATTTVSYTMPAPSPLSTLPRIAASNGARDVGYLNAERERWGLPGAITEDATWSQACASHDAYMAANHLIEHPEQPGLPGYSPGGNWAGNHSILAEGSRWLSGANPWEDAPIHLDQLYTPDLSTVGIDESSGYACATTWPGIGPARAAVGTVITYPGDGATGLPPAENASESPSVPGKLVGVPEGTIAGRELFVYEENGPLAGLCVGACFVYGDYVQSASLSSPGGPVTVKWVDSATSEIGGDLTGAIIIPTKPLAPYTTYHAQVTLAPNPGDGLPEETHQWSFTTGAANPSGIWPGSSGYVPAIRRRGPVLSGLLLSPRAFRSVARRGASRTPSRRRAGTTVSYLDSQSAITTFSVLRRLHGVRRGPACLLSVRVHERRRGPRCVRYLFLYSFTHRDRRGRNHFRFTATIGDSSLRSGAYELRAHATLSGQIGDAIAARFWIIR